MLYRCSIVHSISSGVSLFLISSSLACCCALNAASSASFAACSCCTFNSSGLGDIGSVAVGSAAVCFAFAESVRGVVGFLADVARGVVEVGFLVEGGVGGGITRMEYQRRKRRFSVAKSNGMRYLQEGEKNKRKKWNHEVQRRKRKE